MNKLIFFAIGTIFGAIVNQRFQEYIDLKELEQEINMNEFFKELEKCQKKN